jgi:RNA polymerase sigma factor (sigma-70 family)
MTTKQLTENEKLLAEENYDLVEKITWYWVRKGNVLSYDDVYDVCISSLLKAVRKYDPATGYKFITFYYTIVERNIYRALRDKNCQKRKGEINKVSIETKIKDSDGDIAVIDTFSVEDNYDFLDQDLINSVWPYLNEREEYCIYEHFYKKRLQSEIALDIGTSQVHVSRIIRKGLNKLKYRIEKQEEILV